MKRTEPLPLSEIIRQALDAAGTTDTFERQKACYVWPEVVGPFINSHTTARRIDNDGTLHIYIDSPSLKNELSYMRSQLTDKLNQHIGTNAVTRIIIH